MDIVLSPITFYKKGGIKMSIKLAEGEKVLRTYVYGKVKQTGLANSGRLG